jgi:hypothetical protein
MRTKILSVTIVVIFIVSFMTALPTVLVFGRKGKPPTETIIYDIQFMDQYDSRTMDATSGIIEDFAFNVIKSGKGYESWQGEKSGITLTFNEGKFVDDGNVYLWGDQEGKLILMVNKKWEPYSAWFRFEWDNYILDRRQAGDSGSYDPDSNTIHIVDDTFVIIKVTTEPRGKKERIVRTVVWEGSFEAFIELKVPEPPPEGS